VLSIWHTSILAAPLPDTALASPGGAPPDPQPVAALHILDVDATSPQHSRPDPGTSAGSVRPQLRRGYWRHQAVGKGRTERRRTWVRPITVHGTASGTITQAHQLNVTRGGRNHWDTQG
jgi:hypothetical protein